MALRWTRVAAGCRLEQARQLAEDFRQLRTAFSAGLIDLPKVLLMCELAGWLEDIETGRRVIDKVLPKAPEQTTAQLRARMRRLVLAIGPDAARRRCATAVQQRRVERFPNEDGTADLWGRSLPPQDAAAAWERITAIARAAKAAGDGRSLDQLRADALLDLLIGEGVAQGRPLSPHTAGLPDTDGRTESAHDAGGRPSASEATMPASSVEPDAEWDPAWPSEPPDRYLSPHEVWPDPTGEPRNQWDDAGKAYDGTDWPSDWPGRWWDDPAVAAAYGNTAHSKEPALGPARATTVGRSPTSSDQPASRASADGLTRQEAAPVACAHCGKSVSTALPAPRRGVVELQVPLLTLLRLAEHPGLLDGWAPVVADIARQIASRQADGT